MEPRKIFKSKFLVYKQAVDGFRQSLEIDMSDLDEVVQDSVKNGQIQKFEYCIELTWKIVKRFLYLFDGLDTNSPKDSIKNLFLAKYVDQNDYEVLIEMVEDRNRLAHIYKHEYFEEVHVKLENYNVLMEKVIDRIEKEVRKEGVK